MTNLFRSQILTLIFSWVFALVFIVLGGSFYSPLFVPFFIIYCWIPGFVALYFYRLEKMRIPIKMQWNINLVWSALTAIGLGLITFLISLPFAELRPVDYLLSIAPKFLSHFTPFTTLFLFFLIGIILAALAGNTFYALISGGQELMWRGYVWDKLKGVGFWKSSMMMGFFSGLWYAPLILLGYSYPEYPHIGIFWMIIFCMSISPLLLYTRIKSQSVFGSMTCFGVLSSITNFTIYLFVSPNYLLIGKEGITGFIACLLFNLLLWVKVKKNPLLEYEL